MRGADIVKFSSKSFWLVPSPHLWSDFVLQKSQRRAGPCSQRGGEFAWYLPRRGRQVRLVEKYHQSLNTKYFQVFSKARETGET